MRFIYASERWDETNLAVGYTDFDLWPPDTEVGSGPPPIADLPPTIYNGADNDYKSLCDLVDSAFSRLPDDCKSLYERCINSHGSFSEQEQEEHWSIMVTLEAHIEETKHELGLDVRDEGGSDSGQGECPVHGEQASDEEHADLFQQQHEGDGEELARSLVGPSAHHASGFIPARLGAHEPKFQGMCARLIQTNTLGLTRQRREIGTSFMLVAFNH